MAVIDPHLGQVGYVQHYDQRQIISAAVEDMKRIEGKIDLILARLEAVDELYHLFSGSEVGEKRSGDTG